MILRLTLCVRWFRFNLITGYIGAVLDGHQTIQLFIGFMAVIVHFPLPWPGSWPASADADGFPESPVLRTGIICLDVEHNMRMNSKL
jgi:hypothetical protein